VLTQFKESFTKDLRRIGERSTLRRIREAIEQVEQAASLAEVSQLKKLKRQDTWQDDVAVSGAFPCSMRLRLRPLTLGGPAPTQPFEGVRGGGRPGRSRRGGPQPQ
jgi:hypothetical protein